MIKRLFIYFSILVISVSCNRVKEKAKETLNEGGEVVGKGATEIIEGVTEGVERTLDCEVKLSDALLKKGLTSGKYYIGQDSIGHIDNVLRLYLIFNKDLKTSVTAKVKDKSGLETGRVKMEIEGISGDAKYFDFVFSEHTKIEARSVITIE